MSPRLCRFGKRRRNSSRNLFYVRFFVLFYIYTFIINTNFAWNKVPSANESLLLCRFGEKEEKVHATSSVRRSDHLFNKNNGSDVISTQLKYASNDFCAILFSVGAFCNILCWWNMLGSTFWGDKGRVIPIRTKSKVNWWQQRLTGVKLCHGSW